MLFPFLLFLYKDRGTWQKQFDVIQMAFWRLELGKFKWYLPKTKSLEASLQWFNKKPQQIEIQFVTKFGFSDLSRARPLSKEINKGSLKHLPQQCLWVWWLTWKVHSNRFLIKNHKIVTPLLEIIIYWIIMFWICQLPMISSHILCIC